MTTFSSSEFLSRAVLDRITDARIADPDLPFRAAQARVRRETTAPNGRLNLLAADHPARNVTRVQQDELAMADRRDYLARILRVLSCELVDGIMAGMDILEDLLSIDAFLHDAGSPTFLDHRLLIASLNRGGLAESVWELDDPVTGPTPAACAAWRLDGAKLLLRVDYTDPASLRTITYCTRAIREINAVGLPTFLEPQPVTRSPRGYSVTRSPEALAKMVGIASAIGDTSRRLWLKLPVCRNFATVAHATTLPILLLGGESSGNASAFLTGISTAMQAANNVRGLLVGRNVLYPGTDDPAAIAGAAGHIVHHASSPEQALAEEASRSSCGLDRLAALHPEPEEDSRTPTQ